jgi:hypothetical protein
MKISAGALTLIRARKKRKSSFTAIVISVDLFIGFAPILN